MYIDCFLIPVLDPSISILVDEDFISLANYTSKYWPELCRLEEKRIAAIWSGDGNGPLTIKQKKVIISIEEQIKEFAEQKKIPLFILAALDENKRVYEVITGEDIYYDHLWRLGVMECSYKVFKEMMHSPSYSSCIQKFFNRKNFHLVDNSPQKVLKK